MLCCCNSTLCDLRIQFVCMSRFVNVFLAMHITNMLRCCVVLAHFLSRVLCVVVVVHCPIRRFVSMYQF